MIKIICFHKPHEPNGFLSNWWMSDFTDENGVRFTSNEQYMMYGKAVLFGDSRIAQKIMATNDVAEIKALGRMVKGFDGRKWDVNKYEIVKHGVELKFAQNEELMKKLTAFGNDCIFAECAVHDSIWGIGLGMRDPDRLYMSRWRGENLLGKAITEVAGNKYPD